MKTAEFRENVNQACRQPREQTDLVAIVDELEKQIGQAIAKAVGIGLEASELQGVRDRMIVVAEEKWMTSRYPALDMEPFDGLNQHFVLGRVEHEPSSVEIKRHGTDAGKGELVGTLPVFGFALLPGRPCDLHNNLPSA